MCINSDKTKIFPINFSRKLDFVPKITYDSNTLEVTYKTKLLGVIWTSNCELDENIPIWSKKQILEYIF